MNFNSPIMLTVRIVAAHSLATVSLGADKYQPDIQNGSAIRYVSLINDYQEYD
jgi:hypothetical protein